MEGGIVMGGSFIGEWVDTQITERLGEMEKHGLKKILVEHCFTAGTHTLRSR